MPKRKGSQQTLPVSKRKAIGPQSRNAPNTSMEAGTKKPVYWNCGSGEEMPECPICLEPLGKDAQPDHATTVFLDGAGPSTGRPDFKAVAVLSCGHLFHNYCIEASFKNDIKKGADLFCPSCMNKFKGQNPMKLKLFLPTGYTPDLEGGASQEAKRESEEKIKVLEQATEHQRNCNDALSKENNRLLQEMAKIMDENRRLKDDNKHLQDEKESRSAEEAKLKRQLATCKNENKHLKDRMKHLEDEKKCRNADENKLKRELATCKDENKSLKDGIKLLQDEKKLWISEERQSNIELATCMEEKRKANVEISLLRSENCNLEAARMALMKGKQELQNSNKIIRAAYQGLKMERNSIKKANQDQEVECRNLRSEIQACYVQIRVNRADFVDMQRYYEKRIQKLNARIDLLDPHRWDGCIRLDED